MRVLIDYRPALRERTGVGEYVFQLARALLTAYGPAARETPLQLTLFSSSWKDRLDADAAIAGASIVDRRVPVGVLNALWHRLGWPAAETLTGVPFDVAHSPHPLLVPARSAAQVVTIHDLYFLSHPEGSMAEVRRDYPALARQHAHRADHIIVPSQATALDVQRRFEVDAARISVCPHGRPPWPAREGAPAHGYVLFLGTLEPRKNVGGLLDAYERLLGQRQARRGPAVPELVLAGKASEQAAAVLERIRKPPFAGLVRHIGYVDPARRRELYEGACLLVQPSFEEGFGLPVLEAMTIGVPVVAANRGGLPEVLGDAGLLVDPEDPDAMAAAIDRLLTDEATIAASVSKGVLRSKQFDWHHAAHGVYAAYRRAIEHHAHRH